MCNKPLLYWKNHCILDQTFMSKLHLKSWRYFLPAAVTNLDLFVDCITYAVYSANSFCLMLPDYLFTFSLKFNKQHLEWVT